MAAGQPAPLGKVLELAIGEANQLIGTGRAQAVPTTEKGRAGTGSSRHTIGCSGYASSGILQDCGMARNFSEYCIDTDALASLFQNNKEIGANFLTI